MEVGDGEEEVIHSVWLGGGEKSETIRRCQSTWPWLWVEWSESSAPYAQAMQMFPYFEQAVKAKNWAAASDLLRLYVLEEYGGIYLDCDVQVIRPHLLVRDLITCSTSNAVKIGLEDSANLCGAVIVAGKGNGFVRSLLHKYRSMNLDDTFGSTGVNGTTMLTRSAAETRAHVISAPAYAYHPIHFTKIKSMSFEQRERVALESGSTTLHHFEGSWVK